MHACPECGKGKVTLIIRVVAPIWSRLGLGQSSSAPDEVLAPEVAPPSEYDRGDYQLSNAVYRLTRHFFQEAYGGDILINLSGANPGMVELLARTKCKEDAHAVFVYNNWSAYDKIVPWVASLKIIMVIVAPMWEQHGWFSQIMERCTHIWVLPQSNGVFFSTGRPGCGKIGIAPWPTFIAFVDFRSPSTLVPCVNSFPELPECERLVQTLKPLKRLQPKDVVSLELCKPKSPFNMAFLRKVSKDIVPEMMRQEVLDGMENGFTSRYRGGGYFQRDFSAELSDEKLILAKEKIEKDVKKGFCIGPFKACPFPSTWCDKQAIICQIL